ncbi:S-layer homology domain-containing protein [Paenibacillus sp. N1-5-1-14]|uniref:YcdB/YcdC domain-containing protein n=1 Tax=Paenibacillus radicibacter TaxID=2972488 RepID=UPI0021591A54|nr:YcdB/YcdC domain-containing protein [Paenibacillus radicibacter]MCR8642619.1 S-layer homology domain-containing protein [Paenibacillus radicibacter]
MKLLRMVGTTAIASTLMFGSVSGALAQTAASAPANSNVTSNTSQPKLTPVDESKIKTKISKDEAIATAKKVLGLPEGYALESVNLNEGWNDSYDRSVWHVSFNKREGNRYYGSINYMVDANSGRVLGMNMYENDPDRKPAFPPKVDFKAGKELAAKWIEKMNPGEQSQLQYSGIADEDQRPPLNGDVRYNYTYVRTVNGVKFPQDSIGVNVDGDGRIVGYTFNWSDKAKFENKTDVITLEAAKKAFRDKMKPELFYEIPYQAAVKTPYVGYNMNNVMLDAKTGQIWDGGSVKLPELNLKPLTDQPLADKPKANLNLSKEEAVARITSSFKLPANMTLQNANYSENKNEQTGEMMSSWNLNWNVVEDKEEKMGYPSGNSAWAQVNAKTGEIMSYNLNVQNNDPVTGKPVQFATKVSVEQAKSKAIEFVKKNAPHYTNELILSALQEEIVTIQSENMPKPLPTSRLYEMNFNHVSDGVRVGYNSIHLALDKETGDIINYYSNMNMTNYPTKKPAVIAADKAQEILLSQYDVELVYVQPWDVPGNIPIERYKVMMAAGDMRVPSGKAEAKEAKLIYQLTNKYQRDSYYLDATTGSWKSSSTGEIITLEKVKVTDIDAHWAKDAIQLMLDYQALDVKDGKVSPDSPITKGEMVKMLVTAMNGGNMYFGSEMLARQATFKDVANGSKYFAYIETALDRRLIDKGEKFNPDQKMTREEMAQLITRGLGLKKLSQYEAMFNQTFSDRTEVKAPGEAAIIVGLGIMTLSDSKFEPHQEVSRAQAASAFYRFLQIRSILQDGMVN